MPIKFYPSHSRGENLFLRKLSEELDKKNDLYKLKNLLSDARLKEITGIWGRQNKAGRPRHDKLIMVKLFIIQAMYGLSDSRVAELFQENIYYQYFCGFHTIDTSYKISESCIRRFRQEMGEEGLNALMEYTIEVAVENNIIKKKTFKRL